MDSQGLGKAKVSNFQRAHTFVMCIICAMSRVGARRSRHLLSACCQQAGLCAPAAPSQALAQRSFSSLPEPVASLAPNAKDGFVSHPSLLNENLLKTQYAVRGELYNKAMELAASGRELIFTNGAAAARRVGG